MAAPTPTPRVVPPGIFLRDGFSSLITFANDTDIDLWEKTVKPPGLDGGEKVETTTMHNTTWRTFGPRELITMMAAGMLVAYDPICYDQVIAIINDPTTITVTWMEGSTLAFFGYLQKFEPTDCAEGSQPEATVVIEATNTDHENGWVEAAPVLTSVAGT